MLGDNVDEAARLLKALSNDRRLMILWVLRHDEKSVGELEKIVGLSQSALSQHLARLRRDDIVKTRRDAQTIYYSLNCSATENVLSCLKGIFDERALALSFALYVLGDAVQNSFYV